MYDLTTSPKPGAEKTVIGYQIEATATPCPEKVAQEKETLGRFILATNQLNESYARIWCMEK